MKPIILALASVAHLVPHPFGVSSVGATALYAGAYAPKSIHWLVPFVPLTLGLMVTGLYKPTVMMLVFAGFGLASFAGRWLLRNDPTLAKYGAAVVLGATIFFLVSNFAIWWAGYYPPTLAGLVACYVAGLPYLLIACVADALYCGVLFGLHKLIDQQTSEPSVA